MSIPKSKPKYYFEIDTGGVECSLFEPRYSNYGTICAEGDCLDELLASAEVTIIDQDGGDLAMVMAEEEWMEKLIVFEYFKFLGGGK